MEENKELQEFKYVFGLLDKDGDGLITKKQVREIMKEISFFVPGDDFDAFFESHKVPNQVNFQVFMNIILDRSIKPTHSQEEIIEAFKIFYSEGKGKIDSREMRIILENMGTASFSTEEIDKFILRAETDANGAIDYVDFTKKMIQKIESAKSLKEQV